MTIASAICAFALLAFPHPAFAVVSLNSAAEELLDAYEGVGMAAWTVDGEARVCSAGSAGERILGSGVRLVLTGDSRHHVGSVTKSMTATLLAILIENDDSIPGGWNATLGELVPEAGDENQYANATLTQLVGMLSGIPNEFPDDFGITDLLPFDVNDLRSFRSAASLGILRNTTPVSDTPGSESEYSNFAYIVAGHIIEEVTDMLWETALAERLFKPLGIDLGDNYTDFVGAPDNDVDPWGHNGSKLIPCNPSIDSCDDIAVVGPAGTFSGPVSAMARYLSWHMQCHNGQGEISTSQVGALLSQEACQRLHQPADPDVEPYGYGWVCYDSSVGYVCTHNGSNNFNFYNATIAFDLGRVAVSFANSFRPGLEDYFMVNDMVEEALQHSIGSGECLEPFSSSGFPTPSPTSAPISSATTSAPSMKFGMGKHAAPQPVTQPATPTSGSVESVLTSLSVSLIMVYICRLF